MRNVFAVFTGVLLLASLFPLGTLVPVVEAQPVNSVVETVAFDWAGFWQKFKTYTRARAHRLGYATRPS